MPKPAPYILILVPDRDDQQLTRPMIEELNLQVDVHFVNNSSRFFSMISEQEPMLVLLDFNLHPQTGLDLLMQIKKPEGFRHIPVVLLGEHVDEGFLRRCYAAGASSYVVKPRSLEGTRRLIKNFFSYWIDVVETPEHRAALNVVST